MKPSRADVKVISRREIPVEFMIAPASINSGMAIKGKFVDPSNMTRAMLGKM